MFDVVNLLNLLVFPSCEAVDPPPFDEIKTRSVSVITKDNFAMPLEQPNFDQGFIHSRGTVHEWVLSSPPQFCLCLFWV